MDVVIPHVRGHWDSMDLRYTLRSVARFFPGGEVLLVGHRPEWYRGAHVPFRDKQTEQPFRNTMEKLFLVCETLPAESTFMWLDDDTLLLEPYEPQVYHRSYVKAWGPGEYKRAWERTCAALRAADVPLVRDYEVHAPMVYESGRVLELRTEEPLMFRTWYGNQHCPMSSPIEGEKVSTWKGEPVGKFISTGDLFLGTQPAREWARRVFPEPSPWEK